MKRIMCIKLPPVISGIDVEVGDIGKILFNRPNQDFKIVRFPENSIPGFYKKYEISAKELFNCFINLTNENEDLAKALWTKNK